MPPADPRLTAILDRLHDFDHAADQAYAQEAIAQIEGNAVGDIRFLVTKLWCAHFLRSSAAWAADSLRELHEDCLGCCHCDCRSSLQQELIDTESFATWPRQPDREASRERGDNLLVF